MNASRTAPPAAPPKRYWRNYLLDPHFQLTFTGYAVAGTAVVVALLGLFLWRTSNALIKETQVAVEARSQAAETSKELGAAALSNELLDSLDDPAFAQQLKERSRIIDQRYETERAAIVLQQKQLIESHRQMALVLVGSLLALLLIIALSTIVATHKVAGPIFRLKRGMQEVADGKLLKQRPLRQGDEFKAVFDTFARMVDELRTHEYGLLGGLEDAALRLEKGGDAEVARHLRDLQRRITAWTEPSTSPVPPPAHKGGPR